MNPTISIRLHGFIEQLLNKVIVKIIVSCHFIFKWNSLRITIKYIEFSNSIFIFYLYILFLYIFILFWSFLFQIVSIPFFLFGTKGLITPLLLSFNSFDLLVGSLIPQNRSNEKNKSIAWYYSSKKNKPLSSNLCL